MDFLLQGVLNLFSEPGQVVMWVIGALLIWLAIEKDYEPALLLPMGFGAILVNLPFSGVLNQQMAGIGEVAGVIQWLYEVTIEAAEVLPLLLFIGIGAMIDFGPLLSNPKMMLFGASAQGGIFAAIIVAILLGFSLTDAASIGTIGAADGPTAILVSQVLGSQFIGAISVAAYSYMAMVPLVLPPAIRLVTTKNERLIRMSNVALKASKRTRILFPIVVSIVAGLVAPASVALVGFLMFGNLIRECGCLESLSRTAQNELANLITLLLGIIISFNMHYEQFLRIETLFIMALGLVAFVVDAMLGTLFGKFLNILNPRNKVNPMIGGAGISAFPMASRVIHKMGLKEDNQNFLLMNAAASNVSGQIASVVAGGMILSLVPDMIAAGEGGLSAAIELSLKGMAGIFTVLGILSLCVMFLSKMDKD
jgi:sodium ion-translocating decarboxylase beta subunit